VFDTTLLAQLKLAFNISIVETKHFQVASMLVVAGLDRAQCVQGPREVWRDVFEGRERHPLLCLRRSDSGCGTAFLFNRWWYWDGSMSAHGCWLG
jgi:hypothetical protein